jgi:hypothetical protein
MDGKDIHASIAVHVTSGDNVTAGMPQALTASQQPSSSIVEPDRPLVWSVFRCS